MAKRLFAWVLTLALVLSMVPAIMVGVTAEGALQDHTDHAGWTAWGDDEEEKGKLPTAEGKYYLTADVELTAAVTVTKNIHLCLNDHTITQTKAGARHFYLNEGNKITLSIYDCGTKGKLTGGSQTTGSCINVTRTNTFNLYGGTITGNNSTGDAVIYVQAANATRPTGGVFNMYGGTITGNKVKNGVIYGAGGGASYTNSQVNIYGGSITNNETTGSGAAVFVKSYGKLHIEDATITGNKAATAGSAIYAEGYTPITIKNTTITGNIGTSTNAKGYSAAVYLCGVNNPLTVSGRVVISGNTTGAAGIPDVVYNYNAYDTLLVDELTAGTDIKFKSNVTNAATADEVVALAQNAKQTQVWCSDWVTYVDTAGAAKSVAYDTKNFSFVDGHYHGGQAYTAWNGEKITADGFYYLQKDVELTALIDLTKNATVCLNGYDIIQGAANQRVLFVNAGKTFTLEDCTAYYDAEGNYVAGGLTVKGGTSTKTYGSVVNITTGGTMNMKAGKIYGVNDVAEGGSPVYLAGASTTKGKAVFNMTGGEICGNTAKMGAAVQVVGLASTDPATDAPSEAHFANVKIWGNTATTTAGAIHANKGVVTVENSELCKNTAVGSGAIYATGSKLTVKNSKINDNDGKTSSSGAVTVTGTGHQSTFENVEFTGNTCKTVSVMNIMGANGQVILKDVTVTGNTSTGTTYGAVNLANGTTTVKLQGQTVIYGNLTKDGAQQNLHLQKGEDIDFDVTGLAAGSKVGVSLLKARVDAAQMYFSTEGMTENKGYCVSDDAAYAVDLDTKGRLCLVDPSAAPPAPEHAHKLCNDAACTEHGAEVAFEKWEATDSLPESGNYYLANDVTLDAATSVSDDLVLCLNGHTITQTTVNRVFTVAVDKSLTITDCGTTGTITGGKNDYGSVTYLNEGSVFNFYGGKLTGNGPKSTGAATGATVFLRSASKGGATFNMYGGEITGNGGEKSWGGAASNGSGNATNTVYVNLYGGKIYGNTAGTGGAFRMENSAVVTLAGGEIYNNTAATYGGAVYVNKGTQLKLEGTKIYNNTAGTAGGGIYATATAGTVTVSGASTVENNKAADAANNLHLAGETTFTVGELTGTIGLSRDESRADDVVSTNQVTDVQVGRFTSDNEDYVVDTKDGKLVLKPKQIITEHMHAVCNEDGCTDHGIVPFFKWDKTDSLPTSGNYYLDVDVNLTAVSYVEGDLVICLNGHTIKQTKAARILQTKKGGTLTITDCGTTGTLTGGRNNTGSGIFIAEGTTFNLYGGRLTDCGPATTTSAQAGAAIFLRSAEGSGATFNMYGGEITGNGGEKSWGGAVTNASGNATNTVYVNIYGGKIYGNTAENGGAIRVENAAVVTLAGGEIVGNTATAQGGAVYLNKGAQLKLQDTKIQDNIAGTAGGGIYVTSSAGAVTLSGAPVVTDNTTNGKQNNLYLAGDAVITLGQLKDTANVRISVGKVDRAISTQTDTDYTKNFTSDSAYKPISYKEKALWIEGSKDHQHCVCDSTASVCDHEKQVWTAWESNNSLPTEAGYYYLTDDVTMTVRADVKSEGVYLCLNGKTVTAPENKRHMIVYAGAELSITDCTENPGGLTGGKNTYGGFANVNAGATLNLYAGKIYGNIAEGSEGGAIYIQASNKTTRQPGGIFNMYGGEISGNTAKTGAGVRAAGTNDPALAPSEINIYGGVLSDNHATDRGAAIGAAYGTKLLLQDCQILNNTAVARAAGFYAQGAIVEMRNVVIRGNSAKEAAVAYVNRVSVKDAEGNTVYIPSKVDIYDGTLITGNKAETNCGGILIANEGVVMTMHGGEFSKNTAANGAAVMTWAGSTFVMKGGKISNNTVKGSGGGLYISTDSTFKMEGGTVSYNTAKNGGGLYFLRCTAVLSGGSITGNYGKYEIKWVDGKETKSGGQGGGMTLSGADVTLCGVSMTYNKADGNGGAVITGRTTVTENGVKRYVAPKLTMTGGVVSNNTANNAAGILTQTDTVFYMRGGTITKNTAASSGGGIYVSTKSTMYMTGGRVINNHAEKTGGGIYCLRSVAQITGGEVNSNTAVTNSGNIMVNGAEANVTIKNIKLYGGEAKTAGSMVVQSSGLVTVENCELFNNRTISGHGGVVFVSNKSFGNFINCRFFDNESASYGGAVLVNNFANASFTGCEFYENHAAKQGGAVWCSVASKSTMENCTFTKNTSDDKGGAIVCKGDLVMKDCLVEDNTAAGCGGGIATDTNTTTGSGIMKGLRVENSKILNNTAGEQGGGIHIYKGCRVELYDTEITDNTAALEGGAIWAYEDTELHNVEITGNRSGGEGHAVYMNDANYDGHSYFSSHNKMSGNTVIKDNEGGDLWMGPDVVFVITAEGLGEKAHIQVTLDSGVVTQRVWGAYHYEGGNQVYTITYGDRSVTDPEIDESLLAPEQTTQTQSNEKKATGDILLYAGIGVFVALIIVVAVLVLKKKKTAEKATKE